MSASGPEWYERGLRHLWLPYTQMKTAAPPLAVARTDGTRILLADGRVLIDGIASWWTAAHGYNHPISAHASSGSCSQLPMSCWAVWCMSRRSTLPAA